MKARTCPSRILQLLTALLLAAQAAAGGPEVLEQAKGLRAENPQAALELLDRHIADVDGLEFSENNTEKLREQARLLQLRAEIKRDIGRRAAAADDAARVERIARVLEEPVMQARAQFLSGTIQAEDGDIAGALQRFHAARRTLEATDATAELGRVINALGVAHNFTGDFERARDYYDQALALARQTDNRALENSILGNLALVIGELEGPEAGLAAHHDALALARARDDRGMIANQLANICGRLTETDRLEEAATACPEALERVEELGNARLIAGTRMSLGDLERARGQMENARTNYETALALAENRVPSVEADVLEKLAEVDQALGEPARALERMRQVMSLHEELLERERASLVEELEVRYRVEQQEREIELLELDRELQAAELRQRNLMLIGTGIALVLVTLLLMVAWRGFVVKSRLERELAQRNDELGQALGTITRLAREDPLTGLLNRRGFEELAVREIQRSTRSSEPLSLVMGDIDEFKPLNDRFGHATGDDILRNIARRMQQAVRELDIVCRWGGEEFVFLLPRTTPEEARQLIDRVRTRINANPVATEAGAFSVTLTFGIAKVESDLYTAVDQADRAMYRGKNAGRDRIVINDEADGAD